MVDAIRFWSGVEKRGPAECWPFIKKSRTPNGYGVAWADLGTGPKTYTAHRAAFYLNAGRPAVLGTDIMHSCDNRICCNPAHLSEGTRTDNMRDAAQKGRTCRDARVWGEDVNTAKLKEHEVIEVRRLASEGVSAKEIGLRFGVRRNIVWDICKGKTWKHLMPDANRYAVAAGGPRR